MILEDVRRAIQLLEEEEEAVALIPEIGMNIAYAKPGAVSVDEVVGVPGRIHPISGRPRGSNPPKFGGSSHVARAILTIMRFEPQLRSAISLRFNWEFIDICKELGLSISSFDRAMEPPEVKRVDGKTLPWGVEQAVNKMGKAPQVIYDLGDMGKEPMIFLFGQTPQRVAQTTLEIAREYAKR
jgi:hydroxymethylpyrimidine/phosphomethylpyrimidine kinase